MGGLVSRIHNRDPRCLMLSVRNLDLGLGTLIPVYTYIPDLSMTLGVPIAGMEKPFILDAAKAMQMKHPCARCTACGAFVEMDRVVLGLHAFMKHENNPYYWTGYFCPACAEEIKAEKS